MHRKIDLSFDKIDENKEKILYTEEEFRKNSENVKKTFSASKKLFKLYGVNSTNKKQLNNDYKSFLREIEDYKNGVRLFGHRDVFDLARCDCATDLYNAFGHLKGIRFSTKIYSRILDGRVDVLERLHRYVKFFRQRE